MMTFVAVCLGLITLELGILIVGLLVAILRVRQAAQAVEVLAYRVEEQVLTFGNGMRSGWFKALQAGASLVGGLWTARRRE